MEKQELPPIPVWPEKEYLRLQPIAELLLRNGNSLTYPEQQAREGGFLGTQGGWVCHLNKPVDFELVASTFDIPSKVQLQQDNDTIFDELTWVAIEGPKAK